MLVIDAVGWLNEGKAGKRSVRYIGEVLADGSNVSRVDTKRILGIGDSRTRWNRRGGADSLRRRNIQILIRIGEIGESDRREGAQLRCSAIAIRVQTVTLGNSVLDSPRHSGFIQFTENGWDRQLGGELVVLERVVDQALRGSTR